MRFLAIQVFGLRLKRAAQVHDVIGTPLKTAAQLAMQLSAVHLSCLNARAN